MHHHNVPSIRGEACFFNFFYCIFFALNDAMKSGLFNLNMFVIGKTVSANYVRAGPFWKCENMAKDSFIQKEYNIFKFANAFSEKAQFRRMKT